MHLYWTFKNILISISHVYWKRVLPHSITSNIQIQSCVIDVYPDTRSWSWVCNVHNILHLQLMLSFVCTRTYGYWQGILYYHMCVHFNTCVFISNWQIMWLRIFPLHRKCIEIVFMFTFILSWQIIYHVYFVLTENVIICVFMFILYIDRVCNHLCVHVYFSWQRMLLPMC